MMIAIVSARVPYMMTWAKRRGQPVRGVCSISHSLRNGDNRLVALGVARREYPLAWTIGVSTGRRELAT